MRRRGSPRRPTSCPLRPRGRRERSLAIGNAVHAALEASARRSWAPPDGAELETILAARGWTRDGEARGARRGAGPGLARLRASRRARGERGAPSGPRCRSCSGWAARWCAARSTCWPSAPRGPWSSTTRPTPCAAPTRPSSPSATRPSATSTRWPSTARAERRGGDRPRRVLLPRGPGRSPSVETYDAARIAAARERLERPRRGDPRRRLRAHRQPPPRALLRLPGGGAALRKPAWRPQWAASSASGQYADERSPPGRVRLRVAGQPGERGADPGPDPCAAPARRD